MMKDQENLLPRFQRNIVVHTPYDGLREALQEMHKRDYSQVVVRVQGRLQFITRDGLGRLDAKGKIATQTQNSVEVDVTPSTTTVTQVLSDGSAMLKVTYGVCTVTANGKVVKSAMTGFYEEKRVSNTLHVISAKFVGGKGIPATILSNITSNDSVKITRGTDGYPSTPVQVGSSWSAVGDFPSFGSITLHIAVLSFGNQNGRATVTVRQTVNQSVTFSSQGLTFKGQFILGQTQASYVDDGSDAQPTAANTLSFSGTFTDKTGSNTGTLSIAGADRTVPSA